MTTQAGSIAFVLLLLLPGASLGAPADDPPRVGLKAGSQLTREGLSEDLDSDHWYEGRLAMADTQSITLTMGAADDPLRLRVPRWAISEFQVYRGKDRATPVLIGLGVGLGAGFAWGAILHSGCSGFGCEGAWVLPPLITAAVGATVGAFAPRPVWETVPVDSVARQP